MFVYVGVEAAPAQVAQSTEHRRHDRLLRALVTYYRCASNFTVPKWIEIVDGKRPASIVTVATGFWILNIHIYKS